MNEALIIYSIIGYVWWLRVDIFDVWLNFVEFTAEVACFRNRTAYSSC